MPAKCLNSLLRWEWSVNPMLKMMSVRSSAPISSIAFDAIRHRFVLNIFLGDIPTYSSNTLLICRSLRHATSARFAVLTSTLLSISSHTAIILPKLTMSFCSASLAMMNDSMMPMASASLPASRTICFSTLNSDCSRSSMLTLLLSKMLQGMPVTTLMA